MKGTEVEGGRLRGGRRHGMGHAGYPAEANEGVNFFIIKTSLPGFQDEVRSCFPLAQGC
jgi:hypothetical protein